MAIAFEELKLVAPDGAIIGILSDREFADERVMQHPLAKADAVTRAQMIAKLLARRRAGESIVMVTHDEALLERVADEVWWLRGGELAGRGDPQEVLPHYRAWVAEELRKQGIGAGPGLTPSMRMGDGRAELEDVALSNTVWRSGEEAVVRVRVRYRAAVEKPVIGMLIRTRIGLNVYGTNTELENIDTGAVAAGDRLEVTYRFRCDLCPGDYTITVASHDADGVWHDWAEDAVAFAVADARYTAGVANLRARVTVEHSRP